MFDVKYIRKPKAVRAKLAAVLLAILPSQDILADAIEEVIVTARKREEALQNIPITVASVSGQTLQTEGIVNVEALSLTMPGLHVQQTPGSSDLLTIRGIGTTGVSASFEQAVGFLLDGVYHGRSRFGRASFLDVHSVEVLKGPQGALLGKNTTAGAINVRSNRPTDVLEGYLVAGRNLQNVEGFDVEGASSLPISDRIRSRVAVRFEDTDGFVENLFTAQMEVRRKDLTARFMLEADLTDAIMITGSYQAIDNSRTGRPWEVICPTDSLQELLGDDCQFNLTRNSLRLRNGVVTDETSDMNIDLSNLTLDWAGRSFHLASISSFTNYLIEEAFDVDSTPSDLITTSNSERYSQFSHELRITSTGENRLDYITGIYYQETDLHFLAVTDFNVDPQVAAGRRNTGTLAARSISVFGRLDWDVSDLWRVSVSGRYTKEDRRGTASQFPVTLYTSTVDSALCAPPGPGFRNCNDLSDSISESDFSPGASLQWFLADNQMLYASYATGSKAGGFSFGLSAPQIDSTGTQIPGNTAQSAFSYGNEESSLIEIGGRHLANEGALRFNWSIFDTEVDDLQVAALDPVTSTTVTRNASVILSRGVEIDLDWLPTDSLAIGLDTLFLEAEFDDFALAPCYQGQSSSDGCEPAPGTGSRVQDLGGSPMPYAPDYQVNLSFAYGFPVANGALLTPRISVMVIDDRILQVDNDPLDVQGSFTRADVSLTYASPDERWTITLAGRNVTNRISRGFGNDLPGFPGTHFAIAEEPRVIALRLRWAFDN